MTKLGCIAAAGDGTAVTSTAGEGIPIPCNADPSSGSLSVGRLSTSVPATVVDPPSAWFRAHKTSLAAWKESPTCHELSVRGTHTHSPR